MRSKMVKLTKTREKVTFYWLFPLRNAVQVQFSAYYFYDSLHAPLRFHSLRSQEDTIFYTDLILISQFPRLFKDHFYYHFQIEFEEGSNPHQWTLKTSDQKRFSVNLLFRRYVETCCTYFGTQTTPVPKIVPDVPEVPEVVPAKLIASSADYLTFSVFLILPYFFMISLF